MFVFSFRRMIITHIQHRTEASKLNLQDLFFLWCFVRRRPLNLPRILLLQLCRRGALVRATSPIHSGHLITVLARSYNINLSEIRPEAAKLLGHSGLSNWKLIHQVILFLKLLILTLSSHSNLCVRFQVGDGWVLREGLIPDTRGGAPAAAEPRPPRVRARASHASQASIDQLSTQLAQIDSRLMDVQGVFVMSREVFVTCATVTMSVSSGTSV